MLSGIEGLPKDTGRCGVPASRRTNHFMFMKLVPVFNPSPCCTATTSGFYCVFVVLVLAHPFLLDLSDDALMQSSEF